MTNDIREDIVRLERLEQIRSVGTNPYPAKTEDHISIGNALSKPETETVSVVGRLISKREMGKIGSCFGSRARLGERHDQAFP